jgi:hypothetical protein
MPKDKSTSKAQAAWFVASGSLLRLAFGFFSGPPVT